jgi:hypothetical protein
MIAAAAPQTRTISIHSQKRASTTNRSTQPDRNAISHERPRAGREIGQRVRGNT